MPSDLTWITVQSSIRCYASSSEMAGTLCHLDSAMASQRRSGFPRQSHVVRQTLSPFLIDHCTKSSEEKTERLPVIYSTARKAKICRDAR
jgi:hypothetical protein